jgi:HK97 family phage prohead protease
VEHLLLKAVTTAAAHKGEFTAVISTATVDREKDIVDPAGFVRALHKWVPLGKKIPLAWNHSTKAEDQIGYVDPGSARVQDGEVVVTGWIDQDTPVGQDAWRQVKMGTLGFSFGYLPLEGAKRKGGGRYLTEVDVYEITATPTPMNADTRVLDFKAMAKAASVAEALTPDRVAADGYGTAGQLATDAGDDDAGEMPLQAILDAIEELQEFIDAERSEGDPSDVVTAQRLLIGLQQLAQAENAETGGNDGGKSVRSQALELARAVNTPVDGPSPEQIELVELREQHEQTTARVKALEGELADANRRLVENHADSDAIRRASEALTLGAVKNTRRRRDARDSESQPAQTIVVEWIVPETELAGAKDGGLKALWTTAYVNDLPDSAFLHVEPGGTKDSDGKTTPRSLRHFPYKDASGAVDLPHLRNALARIPQSSLPQAVKDELTARAQRILDSQKALVHDPDVAVDVTARRPEPRAVDPLVQEARALALKWHGNGIQPTKPPREEKTVQRPEFDEDELRRQARDLTLAALRAGTSTTTT